MAEIKVALPEHLLSLNSLDDLGAGHTNQQNFLIPSDEHSTGFMSGETK